MIDRRQRGGTVAQLKVASKRRVQVAMEGKARERWGDFILSAILMLVSEWERITKDATKGTQRTRWDLRPER